MARLTFAKFGDIVLEWDNADTLHITRQSDMQSILLSSSEWLMVLRVADLHTWPTASPSPAADMHGQDTGG